MDITGLHIAHWARRLVVAVIVLGVVSSAAMATIPSSAASSLTIASIAPASGPSAGGTSVVITGTGFIAGAKVSIGGAAATSVAISSDTTITATTPPGMVGSASVVVTLLDNQSATLATAFTYTSSALGVTAVSPSSGPPTGGTSVTITGTGFLTGATVTIGGNVCTGPTVVNATTITCVTPAGTAGAANIIVTNADGRNTVLASGYTYTAASPGTNTPPPTVTGIAPNSGPTTGGTALTITGSGFTAGIAVTIAGLACANVTVFNSGKIVCTTPVIAVGIGGAADVVVTGSNGQSVTIAGGFNYIAPPDLTLTNITPNSGPIAGGTNVVISGTSFRTGTTVTIGGVACSGVAVFNSGKTLSCVTSAGTAGKATVTVTNPDTQTASLGGAFMYGSTPTITSVTPSSGPPAGGTAITIAGTNFQTSATVKIGANVCANSTVTNATTITCTTPAGTAGATPVVITNPDNSTVTATSAFAYSGAASTITINPNSGPPAGGTGVTIAGAGFAAGTTVTIGGSACAGITVPAPTTITCTTPAGTAGAADVVVTPPGGSAASIPGGFTYTAPSAAAPAPPPPAPATTPIAPAFQPVGALVDSDQHRFFKETGHTLNLGFNLYWETHGALRMFGYPLSEEFQEKGADGQTRTVQYFERARFEYHPEFKGTPYEVELGLLGREVTQGRESEPPFHRTSASANRPDKLWFNETGQPLDGSFKKYWDANGGLAVLGYPITHPFDEKNAADGKTYQVQYFERERFEYHPEFKGTPNEVMTGLLGKEVAVKRGYLPAR